MLSSSLTKQFPHSNENVKKMYKTKKHVFLKAFLCPGTHRFVCHGLVTGESYVFRVKALNAAGLSECSQESEAIKVKAAIGE